jgi:hypothetical protein
MNEIHSLEKLREELDCFNIPDFIVTRIITWADDHFRSEFSVNPYWEIRYVGEADSGADYWAISIWDFTIDDDGFQSHWPFEMASYRFYELQRI